MGVEGRGLKPEPSACRHTKYYFSYSVTVTLQEYRLRSNRVRSNDEGPSEISARDSPAWKIALAREAGLSASIINFES